jgi:5-formyltetrahydrofolate cyclo-ligase
MSDKSYWRRSLRDTRREFASALTPDERMLYAVKLAHHVIPHINPNQIIGSYHPVGWEIDPQPLHLLLADHQYALPRVQGPAQPLHFHMIKPDTILSEDYANIPAPPQTAKYIIPDVLLVPLLGIDFSGIRLGQGQGHYDATIKELRAQKEILIIGLAYECQITQSLPHEAHDERLDAVATPERFLKF